MNERIGQLAEQAGLLGPSSRVGDAHAATERFAELIIRECIQNIRDNMKVAKIDTLGDKDLFLETLRTSGHFYITELEQHFGVEE